MPENEKKFNAFISYRHKPLDMAIATRLQRHLENFRLPVALKGGRRNIRRIFRDRAELPTTSNLIDSIYTSLDESEFLIVICSSFTDESVYIEREVSYFLEKSSADKIIVLHIQDTVEASLPNPLKDIYEQMKAGTAERQFKLIDVAGKSSRDTLNLLKTEYIRIVSVLLQLDETRLGELHYRKLLFRSLALYIVMIALFFAFRLIYNDRFSAAVELNEKLDTLSTQAQAASKWADYHRERVIYWTSNITSQMLLGLQYTHGSLEVMKGVLEENADILSSIQKEDVSQEVLHEIINTYSECARAYLRMGDIKAAERYFGLCFSLWDEANRKEAAEKQSGTGGSLPGKLFNAVFSNGNADELQQASWSEYTKSEHYRIASILYTVKKEWDKAREYEQKAYNAIEAALRLAHDGDGLYQKAYICNALSGIADRLGQTDEAIKYMLEANACIHDAKETIGETYSNLETAVCNAGLSILYYRTNQITEADRRLRSAQQLVQETEIPAEDEHGQHLMSFAYIVLGDASYCRTDFASAEEYYGGALRLFETALADSDTYDMSDSLASCLLSLAEAVLAQGRAEDSEAYLDRAYAVIKETYLQEGNLSLQSQYFRYYNLKANVSLRRNGAASSEKLMSDAQDYANDEYDSSALYKSRAVLAMNAKDLQGAKKYNRKAKEALEGKLKASGTVWGDREKNLMAKIDLDYAVMLVYEGNFTEAEALAEAAEENAYPDEKILFAAVDAFACFANGNLSKGMSLIDKYGKTAVPGSVFVRYDKVEVRTDKPMAEVVASMLKGLGTFGIRSADAEKAIELLNAGL